MDGVQFLVRHGESLANAGLPTSDPTTIPLTQRGHEQAEACRKGRRLGMVR